MLLRDIRHGFRTLLAAPAFSIVAILSLALGIGINSAMFSGADALLLRPLQVPRANEVLSINESGPEITKALGDLSYPDYENLRDWNKSFQGLIAFQYRLLAAKSQPNAPPEMREGMAVSRNFFQTLELAPALGRDFLPEEDRSPVVILSNNTWERQYASDPKIIGTFIQLNDVKFQIVGVAPKTFNGLSVFLHPDIYFPIRMLPQVADWAASALEKRDDRWFTVKGRLKPGVTIAHAATEIAAFGSRLAETYPATNRDHGLLVRTELQLHSVQAPQHVALSTMVLGISALVLLLSCANVANLLLGRAQARRREMAVRLAIGARRSRLVTQLLTESLILALGGGALGLVLARAGVTFLQNSISFSADLPIYLEFRLDERVLFFSLIVAVSSAIAFGLAPAIQTTRVDLVPALKTTEAKGSARRGWGRNALVAAQVALALMLLSAETFFIRSFGEIAFSDAGFRTDHIVMMTMDPTLINYTPASSDVFYRKVLEQARRIPGVRQAALTGMVPTEYHPYLLMVAPEGVRLPPGSLGDPTMTYTVSDEYFETMATSVQQGRGFLPTDTADSTRVAVINDVMAARYWPHQSPIGKRFRLGDQTGPWTEVVGVAQTTWYGFVGEDRAPFFYLPLAQNPRSNLTLLVETSAADAAPWAEPVRSLIRSIDPRQPVYNVRTMTSFYDRYGLQTIRLLVKLVGGMGVLGLTLAVIGLYALVAYSVSGRTREIGIRMAVGAQRFDILKMILRQGLTLAVIGLGIGLMGSVGLVQGIRTLFTRLTERAIFDPWTFLILPLALLAVTIVASYIPARRAAGIDPNQALHEE